MLTDTAWFTEKSNGKVSINSKDIYKHLSPKIVIKLAENLSVSEILEWIKNEIINAFREKYSKNPEVGALNKAIGGWNEYIATSLLSEIIFDINTKTGKCIATFALPNSQSKIKGSKESYSNFLNLFAPEDFCNINNYLSKIQPFKERIFMPSPDYIIIDVENSLYSKDVNFFLQEQVRDPDSLGLYNFFKGKLHIEDIKAAVSLKTSNRPDRRYQPLFEAAMIKAMGHVLKQSWKYYMVVSELTAADKTIFNSAIAPHGIALEENFQLVDATYLYARKADLLPLVIAAIEK
ncbi:Cfr10I/Bse634I family restriction endonuclease [Dolichospermum sp. UHCC 0259]|uniref:Cfr10I/Bse634I family restriction endonuclease n=1 Tax=Dolichospermum sp. UHCC 0259 TaxID=2590010 RepID=UPI001445F3F5|nr:Cfr10I/Bse634I family restriction endonuclease [Dolichospermum sp. UHCC 0259]MTJ49372.1 deoxyribose-phosphate aldolase [Dolichospermum sp. UHCC 0259]